MKLELLVVLSTLIVIIEARLTLKPSPRRDITFPRHIARSARVEEESRANPPRETDKEEPAEDDPQSPGVAANAAKLRVSGTRRKKVKQVSSSTENEMTRESNSTTERKLHTKIVHVPEPFVVHVEKPYPVYIEKPIIVEKHIPMKLYITKKEFKHR